MHKNLKESIINLHNHQTLGQKNLQRCKNNRLNKTLIKHGSMPMILKHKNGQMNLRNNNNHKSTLVWD